MSGLPGDERKREILAAVAALLDGLDQAESLPEGLSPAFVGPDADLAQAVRALTVEAGEIAADRRARAALVDTVAAQAGALEKVRVELVRLREARAAEIRDARLEAESSSLSVLIDLRDRLHRVASDAHTRLEHGTAVVGASPAAAAGGFRAAAVGWLERLRSLLGSSAERPPAGDRDRNREILLAVVDGVALTLARLDEALERAGVREVPVVGLPFDPSRMLAVGFARVAGAVDGTVTDVEQAGYERDGRVLRPARVRVARTTTPTAAIMERDQEQPTTERAGRTE